MNHIFPDFSLTHLKFPDFLTFFQNSLTHFPDWKKLSHFSRFSSAGGNPVLPPILTWPGWYLPWTGGGLPTLGHPSPILTWPVGGGTYLGQGQGVPTLGYPLPPGCEQTDTCENSTFPSYYVRGR